MEKERTGKKKKKIRRSRRRENEKVNKEEREDTLFHFCKYDASHLSSFVK